MRKLSHGFTIVELTVVIAVIGILSTIGVISFARYQSGSRDDQRASQIKVIQESLEKYYDANGEYPSCPMLTQAASIVSSSVLTGINTAALVTPGAASGVTNSLTCACLTQPSGGTNPTVCSGLGTTIDTDSFAYIGDGSSICETSITNASCLQYTLQYREESTGNIIAINSRRQQNIQSSGTVADLAATPFSFSQVNLAWTGISGATSYNVQYSTDQSHWTAFTPATTNSTQVTGLSLGTTYFFQVQPATTTTTGSWSNTASTTTYTLSTPVGNASDDVTTPTTVLDFQWNTVANATSYSVQYAPNTCSGTFTTLTGIVGPITGSPPSITITVTGLTAGTQLCFQVKAVAAGYTSGWSVGSTAVTTVPAPTGVTAAVISHTQINVSWNSGVATTYTVQYSTSSSFGSYSTISGITGTSQPVTGLQEGTTWYFRVIAYVSSTPSVPSSVVNGLTGEDGAGITGVSAVRTGTTARYDSGNWVPNPGPTTWYYAYTDVSASCPSGSYAVYNVNVSYSGGSTAGGSTGATTATHWMTAQPLSGYWVKFSVQAYCQGPNTNSGWSGWAATCAKNSSPNNAGCPF